MRIAFGIVSLFPGGGLQRDCVAIAELIADWGHECVIYACRLQEFEIPPKTPVLLLQNSAHTNHQRQFTFAVDFIKATSSRYDLIVGFDKLLGVDVLYCADSSMAFRMGQKPYLHLLPRYRTFRSLEKSSFAPKSETKIILLSNAQFVEYQTAWRTESDRMTVIAPTLALSRRKPKSGMADIRHQLRAHLGLMDEDWIWLSIGVQPVTKGLDRTIEALMHFPKARLLVSGLTATDRSIEPLIKTATKLNVDSRIHWLGHREDIPSLISAADLLVHPARYDTTGTVILEAIINGLPVITTAACGYARHVEAADTGIVLREPFEFSLFLAALQRAQSADVRGAWSAAGEKYGRNQALYRGRSEAAEIIVKVAHRKPSSSKSSNSHVG